MDIYKRYKGIKVNKMAFGDELELMMIIKEDYDKDCGEQTRGDNQKDTKDNPHSNLPINNTTTPYTSIYKLYCGSENVIGKTPFSFVEYARYMVETSTLIPFNENSIDTVEENILMRINEIHKSLPKNVDLIMIPCFFNLKFKNFYDTVPLVDDVTYSLNFPFNGITRHKRFVSFTENIRNRRGRKIEGYVEIMRDKKTKEKSILIDSMGQGMGCCGLQITIQGKTIKDTKYLYDMMGVFAPLGLRLSRGTPLASGRLLKSETRWEMLEMSVDCRKDYEKSNGCNVRRDEGCKVEGNSKNEGKGKVDNSSKNIKNTLPSSPPSNLYIPKSRFSPIDYFISDHQNFNLDYNDIYAPLNKRAYSKLRKEKVDKKISKHVSSLFVRDPMVSYSDVNEGEDEGSDESKEDDINPNNNPHDTTNTLTYLKNDQISFTHTDDFENIQSSNWRSVRFKIPTENAPPDLGGWKVELRSMDIQATVFENTALIYLSFLLSEAVLLFDLNLYIPISLIDENFKRANAFIKDPKDYKEIKLKEDDQKLYYRRNVLSKGRPEIREGTLREIFLGDCEDGEGSKWG
ncbi:Glutamate-cysteine ligase [Nosema bombycis CQ1]|uniref:Glutamate--cysteine ligase n=1 Tax=Nosema bombycis (strain CQ1 / CVCC 102059) TaxID=578461 RepID=R0KWY9_NOSB1|nr:Glutamate-cysteine ligase [Nosema bombycis CQ1]|eukprot:EOB14747.1 Glutamate-cysteine ligase [Nosema bombycis CQ1]